MYLLTNYYILRKIPKNYKNLLTKIFPSLLYLFHAFYSVIKYFKFRKFFNIPTNLLEIEILRRNSDLYLK